MRRTLAAVITAAMVGVVLWVVFHPILGPAPPAPTERQTAEPPAAVTAERRLTVETLIVGSPQTTVTSTHFGQSFSVMRLRRGELYDVTISAEGYRPHRGTHRVVGGDGDPIRVVLAR